MVLSSLFIIILFNAFPRERDLSIIFSRATLTSFILVIYINYVTCYFKPLEKGLPLYNGLSQSISDVSNLDEYSTNCNLLIISLYFIISTLIYYYFSQITQVDDYTEFSENLNQIIDVNTYWETVFNVIIYAYDSYILCLILLMLLGYDDIKQKVKELKLLSLIKFSIILVLIKSVLTLFGFFTCCMVLTAFIFISILSSIWKSSNKKNTIIILLIKLTVISLFWHSLFSINFVVLNVIFFDSPGYNNISSSFIEAVKSFYIKTFSSDSKAIIIDEIKKQDFTTDAILKNIKKDNILLEDAILEKLKKDGIMVDGFIKPPFPWTYTKDISAKQLDKPIIPPVQYELWLKTEFPLTKNWLNDTKAKPNNMHPPLGNLRFDPITSEIKDINGETFKAEHLKENIRISNQDLEDIFKKGFESEHSLDKTIELQNQALKNFDQRYIKVDYKDNNICRMNSVEEIRLVQNTVVWWMSKELNLLKNAQKYLITSDPIYKADFDYYVDRQFNYFYKEQCKDLLREDFSMADYKKSWKTTDNKPWYLNPHPVPDVTDNAFMYEEILLCTYYSKITLLKNIIPLYYVESLNLANLNDLDRDVYFDSVNKLYNKIIQESVEVEFFKKLYYSRLVKPYSHEFRSSWKPIFIVDVVYVPNTDPNKLIPIWQFNPQFISVFDKAKYPLKTSCTFPFGLKKCSELNDSSKLNFKKYLYNCKWWLDKDTSKSNVGLIKEKFSEFSIREHYGLKKKV